MMIRRTGKAKITEWWIVSNELEGELIVDESAGPSSGQISDGDGDNDGRQPELLVEHTPETKVPSKQK